MSRIRRATLTLIALAALVTTAAPAWAKDPLVYLSWGAPWGQPGARTNLTVTGDTTRVDTLYLSFDPGDNAPAFVGFTAWLKFHPPAGDTLGAFWHFGRTESNPMALRIEFDVAPYGKMSPWGGAGMGMPSYEHTSQDGTLRFVYAVPANLGVELKGGSIYSPARIYISHRRAHLSGHDRPLCIEWGQTEFAVSPNLSADVIGGGSPMATWNSPDGKVCEPFKGAAPAKPDSASADKKKK